MKHISIRDWAILGALIVFSSVPALGGLVRAVELAGGPTVMPTNLRALAYPVPVVLHVLGSFVFCIFGALQLLPSLRAGDRRFHRIMGRAVAIAGMLSAGTGLWMTIAFDFPAYLQGGTLFWVRIVLSLWMLWLIARAVIAIRRREVASHRGSMLRAYAIGQGASTQAILGILAILITGQELLGFPRDLLMVLAWAVNLTIAEILSRR